MGTGCRLAHATPEFQLTKTLRCVRRRTIKETNFRVDDHFGVWREFHD